MGSPDAEEAERRESSPLRGLTFEPGMGGFRGFHLAWRRGQVRGQEGRKERRTEERREDGGKSD